MIWGEIESLDIDQFNINKQVTPLSMENVGVVQLTAKWAADPRISIVVKDAAISSHSFFQNKEFDIDVIEYNDANHSKN